jgi:tetratricopeptide (TPR) repeat protein
LNVIGNVRDALREGAEREREGRWEDADSAFSDAAKAAIGESDPHALADALRAQSRVRRELLRFEEAEELAELSRAIAELNGNATAAARAINTEAISRYRQQDWEGARRLYGEALKIAVEIGDDALVGWISLNLGVLENIQGDLAEARLLYLECVGSSLRSGDRALARAAYNNLGMVCSDLHEWMEAEIFLARGLELAERAGDLNLIAKLCVNRAEPLMELGELEAARNWLERARATAERVGDRGTLADVERWYARMAREAGDLREADTRITSALDLASRDDLKLERAEVFRELGELRMTGAEEEAARAAMTQAAALFAALGAVHDEKLARARVTEWGAATRDAVAAGAV